MFVRLEQLEKQALPNVVTDEGISMFVRLEQYLKQPPPQLSH